MKLSKNKVATINYTLTNDNGEIIDESNDGTFVYLHGANNIIPGLENALEGKVVGDELGVDIEPKDAYGERDLANIQTVPRNAFPADVEVQAGMQFQAQSEDGHAMMVTVTAVNDDGVVVDGNHPLAGVRLHFKVSVVDIREATEEEIAQGHARGPEGNEL